MGERPKSIEEWGPVCARCGDDEFRVDGYCSVECRDMHEVELEHAEAERRAEAAETRVAQESALREQNAHNAAGQAARAEAAETRAAEAERKLAEYKVFFGESGRDELALAASRESEAQLQQAREALERIERRCDHEKGEDHPLYATAIEFISSEARTALETPRGDSRQSEEGNRE